MRSYECKLNRIWIREQAYYHLDSNFISIGKFRFLNAQNLHQLIQQRLNPQQLTFWCLMTLHSFAGL